MYKTLIVCICFLALCSFAFVSICDFDGRIEWVSEYYDLYHVDAPFGTFWVDIEGRFVFGCGRITSEFKEVYTAKYFKDEQLLTLNMDAEKTPVVPDGTFRFEIQRKCMWIKHWWESEPYLCGNSSYKNTIRYIIHVPALPSVNQTIQWEIIN